MAYKDFINDFKKKITGDVMFFYGAEDFLMDWALHQVITRYVEEEWRSIDVRYLDGETVSSGEIMAEARAYSMFSDKRVVIVRNYLPVYRKQTDSFADELLGMAGENQDSSVVVFVLESRFSGDITAYGKKLIKACKSYEFSRLERAELKAFINKRVQSAGKIIARRELEYLIDLSGYYNRDSEYTLTQFDADIAKMAKAAEGDSLTSRIIEELLIGDSDRYVFNLIDAALKGDRSTALEIAETIIREEDGAMQVTSLLAKQFEIMYDALELSEKGYSISQMAKLTGVNEFRFKKAYQAARSYRKSRLRDLLIELYNIDRDIKRGSIDKNTALELFTVTASSDRG